MALNIIDLVKGYLTPDVVSSVAGKLGESESGVTKALSGLAPVVLGGLVDKKNEASSLIGSLKGLASGGILSNLTSLIGSEENGIVKSLIDKLLGNNVGKIISAVSSFAGTKPSSTNALMNLASGTMLGALGKVVNDQNLDASGLANLLDGQKGGLEKLVPSGLNFGSIGVGSLFKLFGGGNIIDVVKGYLTPKVVSEAANKLGESESGITKALGGLVPVVLGGLVDKKNESPSFIDKLKGLASGGILSNLPSLLGGGNDVVKSLTSKLFGDNIGKIISAVSSFAGTKPSSTNALLNLASGATLGSLGEIAKDQNLDASGLANLLDGQKSGLAKWLPAGLGIGSLGLGSLSNLFGGGTSAPTAKANLASPTASPKKNNKGGGAWWKWLLPLLLLALLLFLLLRGCKNCGGDKDGDCCANHGKSTVEVVKDAGKDAADAVAGAASAVVDKAKDLISFDGFDFKARPNGIEDQVIRFIRSDEYKNATPEQLKEKWFNFDGVNFVFGKTDQLEEGSMEQLQNLATILKANPSDKIKIGGYTDKKGDDATNKKVSQLRAEYLRKVLTDLGVGSQVVDAEGYGEEFATVPETASDEERAVDRKMALRFVK